MKIAIIGAGNVGAQAAFLLIREGYASDILLLDVAGSLAKGKALDLEDFASSIQRDCAIEGSDDFSLLKGAQIVVITAGLARRPGMSREDLLEKNSRIVKDVSLKIKEYTLKPIVIVVTNPVDLMAYLAYKTTGFDKRKVFGMGVGLDAARFANLIRGKVNAPINTIEPVVIASHGESMLPISRLTKVKGQSLDNLLSKDDLIRLKDETVNRGASIVKNLGQGSAYFAPGSAIVNIIRAIVKDEKSTIGVSAYLDAEYGLKGLFSGVPAVIGKEGIESIVDIGLNQEEKEAFIKSAAAIEKQISQCMI